MHARAVALVLVLAAALPAWALEVPARTNRYVNDYADVIAASDEVELERYLVEFDKQTTNQIVVVTWPSLEGSTAEDVTLRFAEAWKPGQADRDNGVVVGVYPNDREARIEVGYGLEGVIPDAVAATILRNEMIPSFKDGRWAQGIAAGVQALAAAVGGEYSAPAAAKRKGPPPAGIILIVVLGLLGLILRTLFFGGGYLQYGPLGRRRSHWGSGGFRGGGGWGGGGGFRGGGGGFGGGGASGRW